MEQLDVAYLHVFPYSERPGTRASSIVGKIDPAIISQRTHVLLALSEQKNNAFNSKYIGKVREVLFEGSKKDGYYYGHSDNYLKVKVKSDFNLTNIIKQIKFTNLLLGGILEGVVIE